DRFPLGSAGVPGGASEVGLALGRRPRVEYFDVDFNHIADLKFRGLQSTLPVREFPGQSGSLKVEPPARFLPARQHIKVEVEADPVDPHEVSVRLFKETQLGDELAEFEFLRITDERLEREACEDNRLRVVPRVLNLAVLLRVSIGRDTLRDDTVT